jgi:hypothetical protein
MKKLMAKTQIVRLVELFGKLGNATLFHTLPVYCTGITIDQTEDLIQELVESGYIIRTGRALYYVD